MRRRLLGQHGLKDLGFRNAEYPKPEQWAERGREDVPMDDLSLYCVDIVRLEDQRASDGAAPGVAGLEVSPRGTAHLATSYLNELDSELVPIPDGYLAELDAAMRSVLWDEGPGGFCGGELIEDVTEVTLIAHNREGLWWTEALFFDGACESEENRIEVNSSNFDAKWRTLQALRSIWQDIVRPAFAEDD